MFSSLSFPSPVFSQFSFSLSLFHLFTYVSSPHEGERDILNEQVEYKCKFGVVRQNNPGSTVELVYSGHPSEAAKWLLYTGGLLIEVFNVYVAYGKLCCDFPY